MSQTYQPTTARITSISHGMRGMVAGLHFVLAFVFIASSLVVLRPQVPSSLGLPNTAAVVVIFAAAISSFVIGLGILRWQARALALAWHSLNVVALFVSGGRWQVTFEDLIRVAISAFVIWWLFMLRVKSRFQNGGGEET